MAPLQRARRAVLDALPTSEQKFVAEALREETVGGALLLVATAIAVAWASSPWSSAYQDLREFVIGPSALNLDLDLQTWAADGLLAIFFFVAGLELKRELVVGQLRKPSEAVLPMVAAISGMVVPAGVYLALAAHDPESLRGWAVPIATDIAFALAVLAVLGSSLPTALRAFLLTLAIVDDLGAILVIAVGFTDDLDLVFVGLSAGLLAVYALLQRVRRTPWWLTVPLALALWGLVHESGVHATIAGVALGLVTRVRPDPGEETSPAEHLEHLVRPLSAGVAVPLFALLAAGVAVTPSALGDAARDTAAVAVVAALVLGKFAGVLGGTWLVARLTRAELSPDLRWGDIAAVAFLSGIGFTVSLLIADLAFAGDESLDNVKLAVLVASLISAALAGVVLRLRTRRHQDASPRRGWGRMTRTPKAGDLQEANPMSPTPAPFPPSGSSDETLGALLATATRDLSSLVRSEIELAKAEVKVDVKNGAMGGAMFGAAGFLGVLAVILLSIAAAYGLVAAGLHPGWAFLIVAVVYLLVAAILAFVGKTAVSKVGPPERTIRTSKETAAFLKSPRTGEAPSIKA